MLDEATSAHDPLHKQELALLKEGEDLHSAGHDGENSVQREAGRGLVDDPSELGTLDIDVERSFRKAHCSKMAHHHLTRSN